MVADSVRVGPKWPVKLNDRIQKWFPRFVRSTKTDPCENLIRRHATLPLHDLQRLAETSPHLLADIGVEAVVPTEGYTPWRLQDGRHLLLRPPV